MPCRYSTHRSSCTLYNDQDEIIDTLSRTRIPELPAGYGDRSPDTCAEAWREPDEKPNSDALFDFIVEFYGHKVEREELKKQTDLAECLAVLQSIITRATQLTMEYARTNPLGPSPKKR